MREAAATLARARHAAEDELGAPVTMLDLHDLERGFEERVSRLEERTRAPAPAAVPAPAAASSPARRGRGTGGLLLLVVALVVAALVIGTRKVTP